ncbi:MAG: hypothetical protein D6705_01945 [Deltaproteobacteria bacterium]|nr:MAG: hypothetical protein D6705_01945 [Deltaproteobacteria bacterium]
MKKTPLQQVRESFGSKADLVEQVAGLVEPAEGESADELRARLRRVSNAKLLHLHAVGTKVKELGGKDALVKKIAELKGQPKDLPYLDALAKKSLGSLLDLYGSLSRKAAKSA